LPFAERVRQNFDDPALIESPLLAEHVAALARGEVIERPITTFRLTFEFRERQSRCAPAHC
jgi:uridine kinase